MTRKSRIWLVVAVLFTLVNLAGGIVAAAGGEVLHASTHFVLTLVGAYYARRIWRRGAPVVPALPVAVPAELTNRLNHLELSVEAVAIEVERVGEGQRFMTHLFAESGVPSAPAEGAAESAETQAPQTAAEAAPHVRHD
ncbi:MAG TPA: hypothetical protein VGT98_09560 [Candidatus Elarobacter sp.]|nr:hypothetical protein [Candidatus Elarobacter sp.]